MSLSRGGLELNEIWAKQAILVEADTHLRRAERDARVNQGDVQTQHRYDAALGRYGTHQQRAERIAPAMNAYTEARQNSIEAYNRLSRQGNTRENRERREQANEALRHARRTVHEHARRLDSPAGAFLKPRKDEEAHRHHIERIAALHHEESYSGKGANEKVHFFANEQDRDEFHQAVKHHYGDGYETEAQSRKEHGNYYDHPGMAKREAPHRVVLRERKGGHSFEDWHGDS